MPYTTIDSASGRDFQIQVADPDVSPSSYVSIGGLRNTSVTANNSPVDITNVLSAGFSEWDPDGGIQNFAISTSGIFDSRTTGAQILDQANRDRVLLECRIASGHGDYYYFSVVINTFAREGAYDNVETFTCSMTSHGRIVYVPAP